MAGRVKKQVVFILPKGFLSNKLRGWWLTYIVEIAPDRKADRGNLRSDSKALPQSFLQSIGEIDLVLHSQLVEPCGKGDILRDASVGHFIPHDVHAHRHGNEHTAGRDLHFFKGRRRSDHVALLF